MMIRPWGWDLKWWVVGRRADWPFFLFMLLKFMIICFFSFSFHRPLQSWVGSTSIRIAKEKTKKKKENCLLPSAFFFIIIIS